MFLRCELERFRKQHDGILHFLAMWEAALHLAASAEDSERWKGLTQLREMEKGFEAIGEHCREECENLESPFSLYLENEERRQLSNEHEGLLRTTHDFHRELTFATTLRTDEMFRLGRALLERLRHHIAYEEGLLKRIEDGK